MSMQLTQRVLSTLSGIEEVNSLIICKGTSHGYFNSSRPESILCNCFTPIFNSTSKFEESCQKKNSQVAVLGE